MPRLPKIHRGTVSEWVYGNDGREHKSEDEEGNVILSAREKRVRKIFTDFTLSSMRVKKKKEKGSPMLSFNPKVATYDIPPPSDDVVILDELPDIPSFQSDQADQPGGSRQLALKAPAVHRRMSTAVPQGAAVRAGPTTTPHNTPKSTSPSPGVKSPDWYEELSDNQISMFKEVFELLDKDGGGTINSEELYMSLRDLDIGIRKEEIEQVLGELDKDGNGEIDFDEFLYAMCMTDRYIDHITGTKEDADVAYSKRQRLFFTAITRFAIKNSLSEIERYYANKARQAPHVISFYTAGARLIGLNDRQLEQELLRLQKASKNQDSPYAKLPFMTGGPKSAKRNKKRTPRTTARRADTSNLTDRTDPNSTLSGPATTVDVTLSVDETGDDTQLDVTQNDDIQHDESEEDDVMSLEEEREMLMRSQRGSDTRRQNIMPDSTEMKLFTSILNDLVADGSVVARLPDVHLVQAIRTKLEVGDKEMLCSSLRKRRNMRPRDQDTSTASGSKTVRSKASRSSQASKPTGWRVPKMTQRHCDMPTIPMSEQKRKKLTIEDVPYIRQKVSKALGRYYGKLQKNHVKTAWNHWDNLHIDTVHSGKLRDNFRKVYLAYSPQKEENVFVIAPWIPGPRYTSATAGKPASPYAPTPRPHSTGPAVRSSGVCARTVSRMSTRSGRPSTVMH